MLSVDARVEGVSVASLARADVAFETRRLPSGNEVHILRSPSGAIEPPYRIVDAAVLTESTVLMFVRPVAD